VSVLINVDVPDLERAIAFYTNAFGLAVGRRFGAGAGSSLLPRAPLARADKLFASMCGAWPPLRCPCFRLAVVRPD
jgi:catechol 2,3-dioxygenase-like lactoylglutathione lyase family enzyme